MRKSAFLLIVFVGSLLNCWSQQKWNRYMQLKSCSITVDANLFTASTFIEMEFYNPGNEEIEGLYQFELKPGQVITAFQLELNGQYRDGSIEEKWKAANTYNTIVGKRVDPALLVMNIPDHYSLSIYPVPAHGSRKVTMTILQLLNFEKNELQYLLPLYFADTVAAFHVSINATCQPEPHADYGIIKDRRLFHHDGQYSLDWKTMNIALKTDLSFLIPIPQGSFYCTKTIDQKTNFVLHLQPSIAKDYEVNPSKLAILWDISGSSSKRNTAKEMEFLRRFIAYRNIRELTIIPFNHKIQDEVSFTTRNDDWQHYLQNLQYEGATQLGCIDLTKIPADMYLLFTDGNNTFGQNKMITGSTLVYVINSSPAGNEAVLSNLAGTGGGRVINLSKTKMEDAIIINGRADYWLLNVSAANSKIVTGFTLPSSLTDPLLLSGILDGDSDTLSFFYGNNNRTSGSEKIIIRAGESCGASPIERIAMLTGFDQAIRSAAWNEILDLGLKEKIVTPNTAFIVLEKAEDYMKYNIAPPPDLQQECDRLNYVKQDTRQQRQLLRQYDEYESLNYAISFYNSRINRLGYPKDNISLSRPDFEKMKINTTITGTGASFAGKSNDQAMIPSARQNTSLSEVVVTAAGLIRKRRNLTGAIAYISSSDLDFPPNVTVAQALQGRVPGLQITGSGGVSGSTTSIRIRGAGSIGNSEPLFVIDGIPVSGNINDCINLNDIESITVLKDAQAAALFGSRAAGGAILIISKQGKSYYRRPGSYRLKDMEDVNYLQEIKDVRAEEKRELYQRLKLQYTDEPGFYFDMAQHFFEEGMKKEAMDILMNAAEASNGSYQVLRAMGYVLESWKEFDPAINIYRQLAEDYPGNTSSWRDLAWAYYGAGEYQQSINCMYLAIKSNMNWDGPVKAMMLAEMNAIISSHRDEVDISSIPGALIKPMSADMRIVLDCNKGNLGSLSIREPGGAICNFKNPQTKNGGILLSSSYDFDYNISPAEYQIKNAVNGKYRIILNYYDYYSYPGMIPAIVRIVTFRNFGKPDASVEIENVIMDNQYGEVEIGEIKWQRKQ